MFDSGAEFAKGTSFLSAPPSSILRLGFSHITHNRYVRNEVIMDDDTKALNNTGEDENTPDTTPVPEEKVSGEVPEPEVEATAETEGEETKTEESIPKKGYESRVRELVKERNEAKEQATSLAQKLAEMTSTPYGATQYPTTTGNYVPQEPIMTPGEEITAEELDNRLRVREARMLSNADQLIQLRAKQNEAIHRINNDANDAIKSYPELDPESDNYNSELSERVTKTVSKLVKADPYNTSVKEEVKEIMALYKKGVTKEVGKVTENIAKQVSETALRPTSIPTKEKSDEELSIAELEKKYGMVQS